MPEHRLECASRMRELILMARQQIEEQRPIEGVQETYRCVFCGVGQYKVIGITGDIDATNASYPDRAHTNQESVYLECPNCGNCQQFKLRNGGDRWFPDQESKRRSKWR